MPPGLDCSGLVYWALQRMGKNVPRLTAAGYQARSRSVGQVRPGDLAFWGNPAYHVGIVSGAGRMIHAPQPGSYVSEVPIYGGASYGRLTYDDGGWLQPGLQLTQNSSNKPEPVFSAWQWDIFAKMTRFPEQVSLVLEDGVEFKAYIQESVGARGSTRSILGTRGVGR